MRPRVLSGRQVVTVVVTICLTIVLVPTTVWAASASLVRITGGNGKLVRVDKTGHLLVADGKGPMTVDGKVAINGRVQVDNAMTSINTVTYVYPATASAPPVQITDPTRATLAVTELAYDNSLNVGSANNNFSIALGKITVGSNGACTDGDSVFTPFRRDGVQIGADVSTSFPVPLVFKPTGTKRYCIGVAIRYAGTIAATSYPAGVTVGAYVAAGKYSGTGLGTTATRTRPPTLHTNH